MTVQVALIVGPDGRPRRLQSGDTIAGIPGSVSNSDGSLTISPTTGSVVASINLAHNNTWTTVQSVQINAIGSTSTDGIVLKNTTAATASQVQWSPRLHLIGQGWSTSYLQSQVVDWVIENQTVADAVYAGGNLVLSASVNGQAYTKYLSLDAYTGYATIYGVLDCATTMTITSGAGRNFFIDDHYGVGSHVLSLSTSTYVLSVANGVSIGFSAGSSAGINDVALARSAANIMQVTNGSTGYGALICGSPSATTVGLTVKGAASQSADLQQWQDSSANVLAKINSIGAMYVQSPVQATGTTAIFKVNSGLTGYPSTDLVSIPATGYSTFRAWSNQAWLSFDGTFLYTFDQYMFGTNRTISNVTRIQTSTIAGVNYTGHGISMDTAGITAVVSSTTTTDIGVVVKGAASQTADLQQWQASGGTVLSGVDANGYVRSVTGSGAPSSTPATGSLYYDSTNNKLYAYNGTAWKSVTLT